MILELFDYHIRNMGINFDSNTHDTPQVKGHEWGATLFAVHEVVLKAAVDNKAEPEDLPLAPWI